MENSTDSDQTLTVYCLPRLNCLKLLRVNRVIHTQAKFQSAWYKFRLVLKYMYLRLVIRRMLDDYNSLAEVSDIINS